MRVMARGGLGTGTIRAVRAQAEVDFWQADSDGYYSGFAPHVPDAPVLSFLEIPDGKPVEVVAIVGGEANNNHPMLESEVAA